jgi:ABC-2 type transport system permease protein
MSFSLLWTLSGEGLGRLLPPAVTLLSGMIIPLPFFPDWARPFLEFLPFRGLVDTPFRLYTGDLPASAGLPLVLHQALWTLALVFLGRLLVRRGLRRAEIQGG